MRKRFSLMKFSHGGTIINMTDEEMIESLKELGYEYDTDEDYFYKANDLGWREQDGVWFTYEEDVYDYDDTYSEGGKIKPKFDSSRFDIEFFMQDAEDGKDDDFPYEQYYFGDYEQNGHTYEITYYPRKKLLFALENGGLIKLYENEGRSGYKINKDGKDYFIIKNIGSFDVYVNSVEKENFIQGFKKKYAAIYYIKNFYAAGGKVKEKVFIEYLNKDKGYKMDRKYFNSYQQAERWARDNFDKFDSDYIRYEYAEGGKLG